MAFSASLSFSTVSLARPNTTRKNTTRKFSTKPKPRPNPNPNRRLKPPGSPIPGGDAITYTRLPPREDAFTSTFISPPQSSTELKLADLKPTNFPNQKPAFKELDSEDDDFIDDQVIDSKSRFDYGKFELFEVNSDDEDDDEDYDDEEVLVGFESEGSEKAFVGKGFEDVSEEGEEIEKEKGVPAVMRCFDRAKVYAKAGDGGNGVVAIRREKFVPLGGPSGGDGGRGGNIYVEVDKSMNSLLPFRQSIHFRAGRGQHGRGRKQHGAKGEDVVVKVPPGTVIREAVKDGVAQGEVLLELLHPGQRALVLPGGRGGRGNASFKSGTNRVPKIAENGEEGPEIVH